MEFLLLRMVTLDEFEIVFFSAIQTVRREERAMCFDNLLGWNTSHTFQRIDILNRQTVSQCNLS